MKFEILRKKGTEAVELRLFNEDGSLTVWLCDNDQTAMYKLTSLIYERPGDEKKSRRSILVGTFEGKSPERKSTQSLVDEIKKGLEKDGFFEKSGPSGDFVKLLEHLKKQPPMESYPFIQPSMIPMQPVPLPYIGDPIGWPGDQTVPGWPYGTTINVSKADAMGEVNCFASKLIPDGEALMFSGDMKLNLNEQNCGSFKMSNGCNMTVIKATMGSNS